jgi:predicted DCC family thiol-disulfide oxidoreductase YuxK
LPETPATLVYDGDCPFCSGFVKRLRIDRAAGKLDLVNAREGGEIVEDVRRRGYDLDGGMVLILGDEYYHGDEALHRLALMSTRYGWFNRANAWLFSNPSMARFAYPLLRAGRNVALRLLGRSPISSSHPPPGGHG